MSSAWGAATEGIKATKGHRASLTAGRRSSGLPPVWEVSIRNRLLVLLAVAVLTAVCLRWSRPPEERAEVSGTVRYKGKALKGGFRLLDNAGRIADLEKQLAERK